MPFSSPMSRTLAARAGAATRHNHPDAEDLRRDLAEARLAAQIAKVVATCPPLTPAQVDRLTGLLRPGAPEAVSA